MRKLLSVSRKPCGRSRKITSRGAADSTGSSSIQSRFVQQRYRNPLGVSSSKAQTGPNPFRKRVNPHPRDDTMNIEPKHVITIDDVEVNVNDDCLKSDMFDSSSSESDVKILY